MSDKGVTLGETVSQLMMSCNASIVALAKAGLSRRRMQQGLCPVSLRFGCCDPSPKLSKLGWCETLSPFSLGM